MQLTFEFKKDENYYPGDFVLHSGNKNIFDFVSGKLDVKNRVVLLSGEEKSGKTFLSHIWRQKFGAKFLNFEKLEEIKDLQKYYVVLTDFIQKDKGYILEDLEKLNIDEEKIFHLLNIINEKEARLLITSTKNIKEFEFQIPDLQSRFKNIISLKISDISDKDSKKLLITKLLSDRQLNVYGKIVDFLAKTLPNSHKKLYDFIGELERKFLSSGKKRITRGLVRGFLVV